MIGWWEPESMLQNSKSSFRCDLTKQQMVPTLNAVLRKGASKKGKNDFPNFFHEPSQTKVLLYPREGMIWKSTQYTIFPQRTSTKSWYMANKQPQGTQLCNCWPYNSWCTNSRPEHTLYGIIFVCKKNTSCDQVMFFINNFQNILIESILS